VHDRQMPGYGQYCPLALASEVLAERWTLLVLRELMLGARHFNDIHRGVPRMSPSLLTRRLRTLERTEIIERKRVGRRIEYRLDRRRPSPDAGDRVAGGVGQVVAPRHAQRRAQPTPTSSSGTCTGA
jgi:DNA-binding HxlR family transcriptional regulator